jgi:fluoride exporter
LIVYIAVGGVAGTLARWYLQGWIQVRSGVTGFPIGTLAINLAGSLILGFVIRLATGSTVITPELRAGLTIGFCGGFTTMSTFAFESTRLLGDGEYWWATLYMGGTIAGCLVAVLIGTLLAERLL